MHLLITRPKVQADALQTLLEKMGHKVMLAPLLGIILEKPHLELHGLQAIIVTSQNALWALASHPKHEMIKKVPLVVVGSGTASEALKAGFQILAQGETGAADLADQLKVIINPSCGPLLHASGDVLAFDLQDALRPFGMTVLRTIVYRTTTETILPQHVAIALKNQTLDGILLMSPRTTQVWVDLVHAAGLEEKAQKVVHFCLSNAVAQPLKQNQNVSIKIPLRPNINELVALIEEYSRSVS